MESAAANAALSQSSLQPKVENGVSSAQTQSASTFSVRPARDPYGLGANRMSIHQNEMQEPRLHRAMNCKPTTAIDRITPVRSAHSKAVPKFRLDLGANRPLIRSIHNFPNSMGDRVAYYAENDMSRVLLSLLTGVLAQMA